MTRTDIRLEVFAILKDMGVPTKALTEKASFQKDLGLDSLDFAEMILQFELRFKIELPIIEVETINTVQDAEHFLYKKLKTTQLRAKPSHIPTTSH